MERMKLKEFQKKCIIDLMQASVECQNEEILLKAPTGSGKTIIMVNFIDNYLRNNDGYVFVWLTPGNAELEEQSKEKMDKYISQRRTKVLKDVLQDGFESGDTCFINWETVTKKGNNAISITEKNNLYERINEAQKRGLKFFIIIDEQHYNKTISAEELKNRFNPEHIIGISATIKKNENSKVIEIREEDVIAEELITKMVAINENIEPEENVIENPTDYLIDVALEKQRELITDYKKEKMDIVPLILIQIPNKKEEMYKEILKYLEKQLNKEEIAIWLSGKNENTIGIEKDDSKVKVLIMKQAVAVGWDCPRAKILVKLRENMSESFTIQTIGRIRRSVNAKHYRLDSLNTSYLYTYDTDFVNKVNDIFFEATKRKKLMYLKKDYYDITLIKESKKQVYDTRINKEDIELLYSFYKNKYNLGNDIEKNKIKMETNYDFSTDVLFKTKKGVTNTIDNISKNLEEIEIKIDVKEKSLEKELNLAIFEIGTKSGILDRNRLKTLLKKIFSKKLFNKNSLLKLNRLEFMAFVINNKNSIKQDIYEAIKSKSRQLELNEENINIEEFKMPIQKIIRLIPEKEFYKKTQKEVKIMEKNVYEKYPSNEDLSLPEYLLLDFAEDNKKIKWIYKNGESSSEYFSILYLDNDKKYNTFYPDFILQDYKGDIWIIETKGGENIDESSRNIDEIVTPFKYSALKRFCEKNNYKYGFVRERHIQGEKPILKILFDTNEYVPSMESKEWKNLSDVF